MIQRFSIRKGSAGYGILPDDNGPWVSAEAHEIELRACEERVTTQTAVMWATHGREQFDLGYAAGVQAARDAVAALEPVVRGIGMKDDALAAIDALRGSHE